MTFGLRCSEPACRPHPASLPVRVPTVEGLPSASFSFASRLTPCGSATVTVIGPDWLLSSNKILPMLGTLCRLDNHVEALVRVCPRPRIIPGMSYEPRLDWVAFNVISDAEILSLVAHPMVDVGQFVNLRPIGNRPADFRGLNRPGRADGFAYYPKWRRHE